MWTRRKRPHNTGHITHNKQKRRARATLFQPAFARGHPHRARSYLTILTFLSSPVVSHGLQYAPYRMQANWKTNTKLYTKHQFPISCSVCLAFRCFSGGGGHFVFCIFSSSVVCACCFCLQVQERNIYQHHDAGKEQKKNNKTTSSSSSSSNSERWFFVYFNQLLVF